MVEENKLNDSIESVEFMDSIERSIPVGYGGYIIGKKGTFKASLLDEYGAELYLFNDPMDPSKQVIRLYFPKDQRKYVEKKIDNKLSLLKTNTLNTVTSSPEQLKPQVQCGRLVPGFVMNMGPTNDLIVVLDPPGASVLYGELQTELQHDYSLSGMGTATPINGTQTRIPRPPTVPVPITKGCVCVALGSRGRYYRAVVLSYHGETSCVYMLDVGKFELLPSHRLFKIKVKFLRLAYRAVPCKWAHAQLNWQVQQVDHIIYRRFLSCQQSSSSGSTSMASTGGSLRPARVYLFFTHIDCCMPSVHLYVARPGTSEPGQFVDLLELLLKLGLAGPVPASVPPVTYHQPPNFLFYEPHIDFLPPQKQQVTHPRH